MAARFAIEYPEDPLSTEIFLWDLLHLEFKIYRDQRELWICEVNSRGNGSGGPALAALYNVARDNSLRNIQFAAHDNNSNALQFYFHLDFGKPQEEGAVRWEVNIS